jgi:hypothetical protein
MKGGACQIFRSYRCITACGRRGRRGCVGPNTALPFTEQLNVLVRERAGERRAGQKRKRRVGGWCGSHCTLCGESVTATQQNQDTAARKISAKRGVITL